MLKRSKTDEEINHEAASARGGSVLVLAVDADAGELLARIVESGGWTAERRNELPGVTARLEEGDIAAVLVDSMGAGITSAFKVLDDIRRGGPAVRNIGVIIMAATDTNRLFAFQSGADGYLVRPVHGDDIIDTVRVVLGRSSEERTEFRRAQLMGGATTA